MTLFILTETSAGYALLKANDKKLLQRDDLVESTESAEGVCSLLKLKQFRKFESSAEAVTEAAALTEGKVRGDKELSLCAIEARPSQKQSLPCEHYHDIC